MPPYGRKQYISAYDDDDDYVYHANEGNQQMGAPLILGKPRGGKGKNKRNTQAANQAARAPAGQVPAGTILIAQTNFKKPKQADKQTPWIIGWVKQMLLKDGDPGMMFEPKIWTKTKEAETWSGLINFFKVLKSTPTATISTDKTSTDNHIRKFVGNRLAWDENNLGMTVEGSIVHFTKTNVDGKQVESEVARKHVHFYISTKLHKVEHQIHDEHKPTTVHAEPKIQIIGGPSNLNKKNTEPKFPKEKYQVTIITKFMT